MLKKLQFTFEIDPKDLALLLVHAGKMNITSAEAPRLRVKSAEPLALPAPNSKNVDYPTLLAFMREKKKATVDEIAAVIPRAKVSQAMAYLHRLGKTKAISRGVYILVESRRG